MLKKLENLLKAEIDPAFAKRAEFIFQEIEKSKPKKILDGGCGRGFYVKAISLYKFPKEIHGVDINKIYLAKARQSCNDKRVRLKEISIYDTKYPSNFFNFIICSEVLEHLDDDKKALAELKRMLKPNGSLIITVPNYNFPFLWDPLNWLLMKLFNMHVNKNIWWLAGIWADHERLYSKESLIKLVEKQNFTVNKTQQIIHYCWPFSHFLLYGIGKNLVERIGIRIFNRFNFREKDKASLIAKIFNLPSRFDNEACHKSFVCICLLVTKKVT